MEALAAIYLLGINLAGFIAMGLDKHRARKNAWRIRERTLFLLAGLGGAAGSWLGMRVFHHKTRHDRFRFGIPAILIAHLILAALIAWRI